MTSRCQTEGLHAQRLRLDGSQIETRMHASGHNGKEFLCLGVRGAAGAQEKRATVISTYKRAYTLTDRHARPCCRPQVYVAASLCGRGGGSWSDGRARLLGALAPWLSVVSYGDLAGRWALQ